MLRAIETGYVQREIQNAAYEYQQAVERGERVVVGVNRFRTAEETPIPVLRVDPAIERAQIERLRAPARHAAMHARTAAASRPWSFAHAPGENLRCPRFGRRRSLCHGRRNFRRAAPRLRRPQCWASPTRWKTLAACSPRSATTNTAWSPDWR
jgi:hypothetical protein